ncbi:MAG: HD domain-containing protein [Patescibacteria group bacterium]
MIYHDKVYGELEIDEPVILELINSPSLQRLKYVDQAGYLKPYFSHETVKRFDHSVGVFLLLKKFGAPLEEQIAGLIHDVSHAAFSHCIDYVLDAGSEAEHNHQDNVFDAFVRKSEIPEIIKKYNLDLDYILNDDNFPLKEKNLPDLCADRIDYVLRTAVDLQELGQEQVTYLLENLKTQNGNWFFSDFESAKKFADNFFLMNQKHYAGLRSAVMFRTVGDYLRHAIKNNYITEADLYTTDDEVLQKISFYFETDERLKYLRDRMDGKIKAIDSPDDFEAKVAVKSRAVDPYFLSEGGLKRLSEADENWKKVLAEESKPKEYFLKFCD